jgi:hypothetical protein
MFQTKVVEKIKTQILYSITFLRKSCCLWDNVEKYCRAEQATDENMAHAHCMLGTQSFMYTFSLCNTYCFPTTTMVARTRLIVTLYAHCVSCLTFFQKSVKNALCGHHTWRSVCPPVTQYQSQNCCWIFMKFFTWVLYKMSWGQRYAPRNSDSLTVLTI